jgi:solute carrier family 25 (mitochondrial thiamine pyrophosphate transporter), member 19
VFEGNDFACGFAAGSIARLVVHPLDVVKKRFQVAGFSRSLAYGQRVDAEAYRTFFSAVRTIATREGLVGFYKGLGPSLIKSAPASAITFSVFEAAHRALSANFPTDTTDVTENTKRTQNVVSTYTKKK